VRAPPRHPRLILLILLALAALLGLLARAGAEQGRSGDLIASLDGRLLPRTLPRRHRAPVALRLSGALIARRGPLPQIRRIELSLGNAGILDSSALPRCPPRRLLGADPATALRLCGDALVGRGLLDLEVQLPAQPPFAYHASLRAFNSRLGAHPAVLLHVYGSRPPSSFVLPFTLTAGSRAFPNHLLATLPRGLGPWPHLARFSLTLGAATETRPHPSGYLLARCPLPPPFTAGLFPFARATYEWGAGRQISTTIVRGCRTAASPTSPGPRFPSRR
jgi:hypothetical protein